MTWLGVNIIWRIILVLFNDVRRTPTRQALCELTFFQFPFCSSLIQMQLLMRRLRDWFVLNLDGQHIFMRTNSPVMLLRVTFLQNMYPIFRLCQFGSESRLRHHLPRLLFLSCLCIIIFFLVIHWKISN